MLQLLDGLHKLLGILLHERFVSSFHFKMYYLTELPNVG